MWCGREHRELKARLISYECAEEKESHLFFIHFNRDRWNERKKSHTYFSYISIETGGMMKRGAHIHGRFLNV